jgi:hypothetical protein
MEFKQFIFYFFEWAAFIFSIYYYKKQPSKPIKYLVMYLGFTIVVETIGFYTFFIDDWNFLSFLKETSFEKNYWLYNVYLIITFLFYILFFKWFLRNTKTIRFLDILSGLFLITSISILVFSDVFFIKYPAITLISGTVLVLISIFSYYLELINSDRILNLSKSVIFYISVGVLVFHLCLTPVFIFSSLLIDKSTPENIIFYASFLKVGNYILYSSFILGFIVCAKDTKNPKELI